MSQRVPPTPPTGFGLIVSAIMETARIVAPEVADHSVIAAHGSDRPKRYQPNPHEHVIGAQAGSRH